ncbi:branched-chain amino acid ABC transporter permease [Halobacteriaceae archaeon GCM10025711]
MSDEVKRKTEETGVDFGQVIAWWRNVRERELTIAVLAVVGVLVFPWLFVELPTMLGFPSDVVGYYGLATLILIWAIFAIGFDLLLGYTGLLSFGHAAFWGGAAYAAGIFSSRVVGSPLAMLAFGTLFAVVMAWAMGYLSLRRGGIYFSILTLAFGQMLFYMSSAPLAFLTNGENGFTDVRIEPLFGMVDLANEMPWFLGDFLGNWLYGFVGVFAVLAVVVGYRILNSPYGIVLDAIHENEQRAEFVGLNVWRYKLMAFIISGAFAGVAGSLYTLYKAYVPLRTLNWTQSGEIVIMTILGGTGTLFGPIFGAGAYLYVANIVSGFTTLGPYWHLILGAVFVVAIVLFPRGIWGLLKDFTAFVSLAVREPQAASQVVKRKARVAVDWVVDVARRVVSLPGRIAAFVSGGAP